jgi:transposase
MPVKTDRNDTRGIAQLMRLGWFRPVHRKSIPAQETRALLTARKLLQVKLHDVEMSLGGILRGFGLKIGKTTPARFEGRIRELVVGHPSYAENPPEAPAKSCPRLVGHQIWGRCSYSALD